MLSRGVFRAGLIALIGVIAFAVTLQVSLAGSFARKRPQLALMMVPFDATARSRLAGQLVAAEDEDSKEAARSFAFDAVRRDPLQPVALRVLGQARDSRNPASERQALKLMQESERLSRRDLQTQMWLIDYHSRHDNLERTVRHFDLALRFSDNARSAIFPLLTAAASDLRVRNILLRTLARRPNWAREFGVYSAVQGSDLEFAVTAVGLLLDPSDPDHRAHYATLLRRIVDSGRPALAWSVYTDPRFGFARDSAAAVRNGGFDAVDGDSPFDWSFSEEADLWAAQENLGDNVVLRIAAYNGRSGEAARQLLHLPAGTHRLNARFGDVPESSFERPELRIVCEGRGDAVVQLKPRRAGAGPWQLSARFEVPPNCDFQRLSVSVAGEGALAEQSAWLDDVGIE